MTPEPCGPFCPFAACLECAYAGGESGDPGALAKRDKPALTCENGRGNDERPAASTAGRPEPLRFALRMEGAYLSW